MGAPIGTFAKGLAGGAEAIAKDDPVGFFQAGIGMLDDLTEGHAKDLWKAATGGEFSGCIAVPSAIEPDGTNWVLLRPEYGWSVFFGGADTRTRPYYPDRLPSTDDGWPVGTRFYSAADPCDDPSSVRLLLELRSIVRAPPLFFGPKESLSTPSPRRASAPLLIGGALLLARLLLR